ncbi:hypothetical protein FO519_003479 [Halicephalobus sp. NKZ332]|nr:hypothetical protein FO519_003479 [Halicephalobus sp. NKZ332]
MVENGQNNESTNGEIVRAIAKFTFSGKNNDELSFEKNDIILVTQQLDGGWWEGNLDGKIGWFPSDFVGVIKDISPESTAHLAHSEQAAKEFESNQALNRKTVILEYTAKEKEHLRELTRIHEEFLRPIRQESVLKDEEYSILACNLEEILRTKAALLTSVVNQAKLELNLQRIGAAFLDAAPRLKELLTEYCLNHPSAVSLMNDNRNLLEDFLSKRSKPLELKDLIFGLSLVFRHIEKYAVVLQEIERNYPDAHADRGNLQRAGSVFRSIWQNCAYLRKQKEIQLEFQATDYLEKWFGKDNKTILGDMIHIGGVTVGNTRDSIAGDLADRKIILFSKMVLFLESSSTENGVEYKLGEKFSTNDIVVSKKESSMSLEFKKNQNVLMNVNSLTNEDFHQLIDALTSCGNISFNDTAIVQEISPISPKKIGPSDVQKITDVSPIKKVEVSQLPQAQQSNLSRKESAGSLTGLKLEEIQAFMAENVDENDGGQNSQVQSSRKKGRLYSGSCLRPYPAPRGVLGEENKIRMRKGMTEEEKEDAHLLKIIEGYCSGGAQGPLTPISSALKRTISYPDEVRPQLIVAEDEKILVEERDGDILVYKERTLVDTVYSLKDQVSFLQKEVEAMRKHLEKEQRARRRLEDSLRRSSQQLSVSSTPKPNESEQQ